MAAVFPTAPASSFEPASISFGNAPDVTGWLPPGAADKMRMLRQRAADLNKLIPEFQQRHDLATAKTEAEGRLRRLTDHRSKGGFELPPTDERVIHATGQLEKCSDELERVSKLYDERSEAWGSFSQLVAQCEAWLKGGRPPGTVLEDHDVEPQLLKGEDVAAGLTRLRRRASELRADRHRIRSSCYLSSHCKQRVREMITELAERGRPSLSRLIEADADIEWPTVQVRADIHNAPGAVAFHEQPDALALVAYLFRDTLVAKLDAEIASEADDKAALSHADRERQEAAVSRELLEVERDIAALIWRGLGERLPLEFDHDLDVRAILAVEAVAAPREAASGTTAGWSFGFGTRR
jgi:hypothetical protein